MARVKPKPTAPYLLRITTLADRITAPDRFPFSLPFVPTLDLDLARKVTFFVGENGSGKSTLLEAIAELCGYPAAGGGKNDSVELGRERSPLVPVLRPAFRMRPHDGFFFRAETLASFADVLEEREKDPDFLGDPYARYGGRSLHTRSHGEGFLDVFRSRLGGGLFLLDEPEAALSPQRMLALLVVIDRLVSRGATQIIAATHSPLLLSYPEATILSFDDPTLPPTTLRQTSHYQITQSMLADPERYWRRLRDDSGDER